MLSPLLFAIYINDLIISVNRCNLGLRIHGICYSCIVYADDILLLSNSLTGMQTMLNVCNNCADDICMSFNVNKSVALRFGPRYRATCAMLSLGGMMTAYVDHVKYILG